MGFWPQHYLIGGFNDAIKGRCLVLAEWTFVSLLVWSDKARSR